MMNWFLGFLAACAVLVAFCLGGNAGYQIGRKDERRWQVFSADCIARGMTEDDCRRAWNMEDRP